MRLLLAALTAAILIGPAAAQTVVVPAPGVPGGQVKLVPRDQLRVGPGVKTARLHPKLRAAVEEKAIAVPDKWDWTTTESGLVKLPMLGNDQYGDCYYVTIAKLFILYQWQVQKTQLSYNQQQLVSRYQQLSGGDNGLSDSDVFPELKGGVIGPNGPHKALDVLVVPSSDKAARALTGWAFGPQMFTFTVYQNFSNGAKPGAVFTGSSGRAVGGHAVPFSGRKANGNWQLETWGMQPCVEVTDSWVQSVDPEFVAVFSLEWFDSKGYAPNGLHYNDLAALWNSMGGHVPTVSPFPPPAPNPPTPPLPPVPPTPTPTPTPTPGWDSATQTGSIYYKNGAIVGFGPLPAPADPAIAAFAGAFGKVDPILIVGDLVALYAAYQSKDPVAIAIALAKLVGDLKGPPTPPAPPPAMSSAPMPSSAPGATLYGQCYTDPATGQTVCPGSAPKYRFAPFGGRFRR